MAYLYTISLYFYLAVIRVASLFNPKAKEWLDGRKDEKWRNLETNGRKVVWFHCASLGEFDQGLPLMDAWKEKFPNDFLLVTFFSPSGMKNYHKRKHPADAVHYLPLDTQKNAREFAKTIQAKTVFFVKYEFWANHLREAKQNGAKVYSVSALFRANQIYFKWYGGFYRAILKNFDHLFLQNENSKQLLAKIGVVNTTFCGDLRFDRVFQNKQKAIQNTILADFVKGEKALIVGSSWPEDENCLKTLINQTDFCKKVILAPHEVNEKHVQQIEQLLDKKCIRYTTIEKSSKDLSQYQILILDTIGHLSNAFQYGDMAYIGGGFSGSLHNILEPAVFGLPVFFGPKHEKFPEAGFFITEGFAFEIKTGTELVKKFNETEKNKPAIKKKLLTFMENETGIAEKIMSKLLS